MSRQRFVLRDETFGYTLFDRVKLRHRFLKRSDLKRDLRFPDVVVEDYEKLSLDLTGAPTDLIYSPIRVYFELTSACNLGKCRVCFNSSREPKPNEMTGEQIRRTLDGLRKDGVLDLRFSGGELTTRPDWFDLLKYAKERGFTVSLNTNGVYSNPKRTIDQLAELRPEQVAVSIDGGREFHDYIRGQGTYDQTVQSLEMLSKRGLHLRINTVLTRGSARDLVSILDLAGRYADEINFFYMRLTGRATGILDEVLPYEELHQFDEKIEPLKPNYPHLRILHGSKVMIANSISPKVENDVGLKIGGPDGFTRFNLLPDGSIWPGGYTPHLRPDFHLGYIQNEGFSVLNVWRNSPKLREFREISLELQKTCLVCPEKNVKCCGASIEMEFYRQKSKDRKNPYCAH
jgi:MoaA/NifB/PqqE/SkfB family radical SAM enzyme